MKTEPSLYFALVTILALLIPFTMHLFFLRVCRLFRETELRQKGVFFSVLGGLLPLAALCYLWATGLGPENTAGIIISILYLFLIYILAGYVYFHFFNMSETARRVRLLIESSRTGTLKKSDLPRLYPHRDIVSIRIERLMALGELRLLGDRYLLGNKGLLLPAKLIFALRHMLFPDTYS
ncbi:MAG: hypothetical protein U9N73_08795 [Candidatus Auribacterota bacterium]|nr:hypothetical protein [Candidatus Auribacterota bacterium]